MKFIAHLVEFPCNFDHIVLFFSVSEVQSINRQNLPLQPSPFVSTKTHQTRCNSKCSDSFEARGARGAHAPALPVEVVRMGTRPLEAVTEASVHAELL